MTSAHQQSALVDDPVRAIGAADVLHRSIKFAFGPLGLLNPGSMLSYTPAESK